MDLQEFVSNFAEQFDDTDPDIFEPNTRFRDIDEYSSLVALSVISMIDEEYDISIGGDDMRKANTVEELFNIVKSKA